LTRLAGISALLTASAGACVSTPPPPAAPPHLWASLRHFAGSGVAGPIGESRPATAPSDPNAEFCLIRVEMFSLERMPESVLRPLPSLARLIVAPSADAAVRGYSLLATEAFAGLDNPTDAFVYKLETGSFGKVASLGELTGALPAGVTAMFTLANRSADEWLSPKSPPVKVHLLLTRTASAGEPGFDVTVAFEDFGPTLDLESVVNADLGPVNLEKGADGLRREALLLDVKPVPGGAPFLLTFRSPFGDHAAYAIRADIGLPRSEKEGLDRSASAAWARCQADLDASLTGALARSRRLLPQEMQLREIERALETLGDLSSLRPAVLFLAVSTSARLTSDFVMAVDQGRLTEYARALLGRLSALPKTDYDTGSEFGALLDTTTLRFLAARAGDVDFPVELDAVLARHLGEVGRDPVALVELVREARPLAEMQADVAAMNLEYLHYPSPSARVRAFDWLRVHEAAPVGFDPLGPAAERSAALLAHDARLEREGPASRRAP
jgi:hypothetical protein